MSNSIILQGIKDVLNHGIALDLQSIEEEEEYLQVFMEWYTENTSYYCCQMETNSCMIETKVGDPLAEIWIEESIMKIMPHDTDLFGVITEILRFIAKEHQNFIDNFRGKEPASTISSPSEINSMPLDSEEEKSTEDEWL